MSALTGFFVFREKLRTINWIGIGLAIVAIVIIALADSM
jgi:multidrug transporter EmrE-like cation transporter